MNNQKKIDFIKSFKDIFQRPTYILLFLSVALILFLAILSFARRSLLAFFPWSIKLKMLWSLIFDLHSTFTTSSMILVILLAILSAINITMMVFYIRRRVSLQKKAGVGFLGIIIGFLGIGCASCGSLVLSSIFGISATASFIGVLPFKGLEFGFIGIFTLLISIYLVAQKIQYPLSCKKINK